MYMYMYIYISTHIVYRISFEGDFTDHIHSLFLFFFVVFCPFQRPARWGVYLRGLPKAVHDLSPQRDRGGRSICSCHGAKPRAIHWAGYIGYWLQILEEKTPKRWSWIPKRWWVTKIDWIVWVALHSLDISSPQCTSGWPISMRDCRDGGKMRRAKRNAAGFLQWWVICHLTYRFVW